MGWNKTIKYRLYAGGNVIDEDEFDDFDHATPYYDDYLEIEIPIQIIEHIQMEVLGE